MKRIAALLLLCPLTLFAYVSPGKPTGFVNDFAGMLKPDTISALEAKLSTFERETQNEIAIVTIATHGRDETIETYAVRLFEEWQIGKEKEDNGVLLLISRDDREMRIEVGYGLEGDITDIESAHIISDTITPAFRTGDYDTGVLAAVNEIIEAIGSDISSKPSQNKVSWSPFVDLGYALVFLIVALASLLGRSKSWWAGGIVGGVLGLVIALFSTLLIGILAAAVLIPTGLLFDFLVSRAHEKHRGGGPKPPWFLGGGGFGGHGGGGFGGFGGGSSGGGGASGRW